MQKSATPRVNLGAKTQLAKLMAGENLTVIHDPSKTTASFDVTGRTVYLPMLRDMTGFMYNAFISHEVAHAIWTPENIFSDIPEVPPVYINITEDARIEKKIQRRYPGTVKEFAKFYKELTADDRDFFGLNDLGRNPVTGDPLQIKDLGLIDRINLHFKIGLFVRIPFSKEEQVFVDMVADEETVEDAQNAAKAIFEFMGSKGEAEQTIKKFTKSGKPKDSDEEGEESSSGKGEGKSSEKSTPKNNDTADDSSGDDEEETKDPFADLENDLEEQEQSSEGTEGDDSDEEESEDDGDGSDSGEEDERDDGGDEEADSSEGGDSAEEVEHEVAIETGHTQSSFDEASKTSLAIPPTDNNSYKFGDVLDLSSVYKSRITPLSRIQNNCRSRNMACSYPEDAGTNFLKAISPTVNLMINQFNMKKAADEFRRTETSTSGSLNLKSISNYKISNDVFLKPEVIPEGDNHGMVMIVDWSYSMGDILEQTVKQTIILMEFCSKVGIPFEVYGFTCGQGQSVPITANKIMAEQGSGLFHMFSSTMKKTAHVQLCSDMLNLITRGGTSYIAQMHSTPMLHTAFLTEYVVRDFQRLHPDIQKTSLIVLTDGDPTDSIEDSATTIVMRDPNTGKNYTFAAGHYDRREAFHAIFHYVKDTCNLSNMVGMYVTGSVGRGLMESLCPKPLKHMNDVGKYINEFQEKNYTVLPPAEAFDNFFVISVNNFDVMKGKSKSKLNRLHKNSTDKAYKKAMEEHFAGNTKSMIFMRLFIDLIS